MGWILYAQYGYCELHAVRRYFLGRILKDFRMNSSPDISIVIPVHNESGNIAPLIQEIHAALTGAALLPRGYEIIIVDDGSNDATAEETERLAQEDRTLRVLRSSVRQGASAAFRHGVMAARTAWIITIDGDGQNDPADIIRLLQLGWARSRDDNILICGVRVHRRDTWKKRFASRFANMLRRYVLRDGAPDTACALKLFRRDAYLRLPFFNGFHRFMPALFLAGGAEIIHTPVNDRPRLRGQSKSDIVGRGLRGLIDMAGVWWLIRRTPPVSMISETPNVTSWRRRA